MKKIFLASDHAGFDLKKHVETSLIKKGFLVEDKGCDSNDSVDYPDYAHLLALEVEKNEDSFGFVFCGSGNGINMTVNKHQGIRSALCWNSEIARLARLHNNANVLALPARFLSENETDSIIEVFLNTNFEGGRHQIRIDKIPC
ncbi:MAG: ribose 5-phosphate isomerase B [Flavobacteriia bacterium]|nr:ribose 5-phosphate isomerase B [Flavobacteriia bacterium]